MDSVKPVPDEGQALTPQLICRDAARAIEFYRQAFGAEELFRLTEPSGKVGHAEMRLADSRIMLADEYPDYGALSPESVGGSPVTLHLYVADVDRAIERATAAGATLVRPAKDEFYGDRAGTIADPFGHKWHLASKQEDVSAAEMQRRWDAMIK